MKSLVQPVILAGGSGTRLWPISTGKRPKHLLEIVGKGTMVEQTLERVGDPDLFAPPMIVGAASQADDVGKLAPNARLILEPIPRGSAAAVALAALATDENAIMLVLPSDHYITDPAPLYEAVRRGLPAAEAGHLITFGIEPEQPETGYGYITGGDPIGNGVLEASSFVEKPAKEVAEQLIRSGKAYWNSGMFMFSAGAMRRELERHAPEIYGAAKAAMERASVEGQGTTPDRDALAGCPVTSIDYAVMEHSDRVAVVPVRLSWSDVGSWAAVFDLAPKDADGNVLGGRAHSLGSHGCLVRSDGPEIVTIGVENLVVIATADHVLVVPLSEAQRVREAAELMKRR
jgi:mannose-1-phosphate guanylyltransferase/mannose-1-phosphate guanylyltransferase/mannose-6-phosphate isomerase